MRICKWKIIWNKVSDLWQVSLNASFTVENSVIIPLFTFIVAAVMTLSIYLHDNVVSQNSLFRSVISLEKNPLTYNDEYYDEIISSKGKEASDYIAGKTVMLNNINVRYSKNGNCIRGELNSGFMIKRIGGVGEFNNLHKTATVNINYPPDYIRKMNAAKKLIGEKKL